jgi:thiol:disulfide interchange protein
MDAIDAGAHLPSKSRSQSALSPVLLWILLAAAVLRVVTAVMDRAGKDGPGLVQWQRRGEASAEAARSGKPVLYDFTAAWCGPCKLLDEAWADASVAEKVNAGFVPVRITDRMREEGRNPPDIAELQRRYEVSAFPTLVVAAPDGRLIAKHEGFRSPQALAAFLSEAAGGAGARPPADF